MDKPQGASCFAFAGNPSEDGVEEFESNVNERRNRKHPTHLLRLRPDRLLTEHPAKECDDGNDDAERGQSENEGDDIHRLVA